MTVRTCEICHDPTLPDDVELRRGPTGCVCARCYRRTVDDERRLTWRQRRVWAAIADNAPEKIPDTAPAADEPDEWLGIPYPF